MGNLLVAYYRRFSWKCNLSVAHDRRNARNHGSAQQFNCCLKIHLLLCILTPPMETKRQAKRRPPSSDLSSVEAVAADVIAAHAFDSGGPGDFADQRGPVVVQVKQRLRSARDLRDAVIQTASSAQEARVKHALLVVLDHPFSTARLAAEWDNLRELLHPRLAPKLQLVALGQNQTTIPDTARLQELAKDLRNKLSRIESTTRRHPAPAFEIFKLLTLRWMLRKPPVSIKELQTLSGFSYPTVAKSIAELGESVARESNRSVQLRSFPRRKWEEWLAVAPRVRRSVYFRDRSGTTDLEYLLRRIERLRPEGLAVGGVVAARHWHPQIDLQGLPRLDLELHAPEGRADHGFVSRLDPALVRTDPRTTSVVLAVHLVHRARPLFEHTEGEPLPLADAVETLLDLHELRLSQQASELVTWLRGQS